MDFRHLAIDGPIAVGKRALAERLATRYGAAVVRDEADNPFWPDYNAGRAGAAFQAQLFMLLARHRQQMALRQADLFTQRTVSTYLFDKDRIYAYLNLDDNELYIYQKLFDLLEPDVRPPDVVIYLQATTAVVRARVRAGGGTGSEVDDDYLGELNEAYNHFFFHYNATPLLIVETSDVDPEWEDDALDGLVKQLHDLGSGTRYYVPRTGPA